MSDSKSNSARGLSFSSALCLIFIVLKLTNNIDWSWWWVLSPLWIGVGVVVLVVGVVLLVALVKAPWES